MLGSFALLDALRRAQASALRGFAPAHRRRPSQEVARGRFWRLSGIAARALAPAVLLVPAPIKPASILDLAPGASLVDRFATLGWSVFLLEWLEPGPSGAGLGLAAYAGDALPAAAEALASRGGGAPWLVGHSLGGTFATIAALLRPETVSGLVAVHAPLGFAPGSSSFRDALVRLAPALVAVEGPVPGSLLSLASAAASPETFLLGRAGDTLASLRDPRAFAVHLGVERWTLEEVALPGALVRDVVERLWRDDTLVRGTLRLHGERLEPARLRVPLLAIASPADAIAPPEAVAPFLRAAAAVPTRLVRWPHERGTVFAHLSAVLGRRAHARLWPAASRWMTARTTAGGPQR